MLITSLGLDGKLGSDSLIKELDLQFDADKLLVFDQLTLSAADKRD